MPTRKSWRHRLETTKLALGRLRDRFFEANSVDPLLPPLDYERASVEEIDMHRKLEETLESKGVLFLGRPCSLFPVMRIVPEEHSGWLDTQTSPVPQRRFSRDVARFFEEFRTPLKPLEQQRPLVCQSPVFQVRSRGGRQDQGMDLTPPRAAQFFYYGNAQSSDAVHRAADMIAEASNVVPIAKRIASGEGNLEFFGPAWESSANLHRVTSLLMDIGWSKQDHPEFIRFQRAAFFEGQQEAVPCDCSDLSDDAVYEVLIQQRRIDALARVTMGVTELRPPPVQGGAWRITESTIWDMFRMFDFVVNGWLQVPAAPQDLVSHVKAGELASVHPKTIRAWLDQGRLEGYGKGRQISRAEIVERAVDLRRRAPVKRSNPVSKKKTVRRKRT